MPRPHKIVACIHCRQMKLKCNAKDTFPAPCSRCTKHKLSCTVDPSFRRTAKRQRADALEKELNAIKGCMAGSPETVDQGAELEMSSSPSAQELAAEGFCLPEIDVTAVNLTLQNSGWYFDAQEVDGIEITPIVIAELLDCFYLDYHPHFPVLPEKASFARTYNACPLLFWVVIAIASKHSAAHSFYHASLEKSVQRLATDISTTSDYPLETVQALLLLCWWPFPVRATINDYSWAYCGLAVHIALQFGVHRPLNYSDFIYQGHLDDEGVALRQRVWVACFIVNQLTSSNIGVPATIQLNSTILGALKSRPAWLPPILEQHMKVAYQAFQICHTLGNHEMSSTGLLPNPLIVMEMFDTNLCGLEMHMAHDWLPSAEIALMRTKLQLYSFARIQQTSEEETPAMQDLRASEFTVKASITAMKLIQTAAVSVNQQFWPSIVRTSVVYAVLFLLKLLTIPGHQDQSAARNSISQAWNLLHARSDMEHDTMARTCAIIAYLSRTDTTAKKDGFMKVDSRMAANIVFAAAWRAKDRFSKGVREAKPTDYTAAAEMENLFQLALDFDLDPSFFEEGKFVWDPTSSNNQ